MVVVDVDALRSILRELGRLTRDLLVVSLDPSRRSLAEDLMRAFDVLTKSEYDIRSSMQPRFHLERTLLR